MGVGIYCTIRGLRPGNPGRPKVWLRILVRHPLFRQRSMSPALHFVYAAGDTIFVP